MKLFCLSGETNCPCYVLKFKDTQIMFDCGLDLKSMLNFTPVCTVQSSEKLRSWNSSTDKCSSSIDQDTGLPFDLKECGGRLFIDSEPMVALPELGGVNLSKIDAILISNYQSMLALPFITEQSDGFKGTVYATDPTIQTGRLLMQELISYMSSSRTSHPETAKVDPNNSALPPDLQQAMKQNHRWRQIYTKEKVAACLLKVHPVAYNEKNSIFGLLKIMAISSGISIGSCNWIVDSDYERISYVAGASTLTTHPRPMEHTSLRKSDIMILTNLTRSPMNNPDAMIGEFCLAVGSALKKGGNVLIPCMPCGVTFDMFECLAAHLKPSYSHIPMYFISGVAEATLAYSNIYAEWLTSSKTSNVYLPEPPFHHAELLRNGRLKAFSSIHGAFNEAYKTPCVIFGGHPTLRCGDMTHFISMYGEDPNSLIIFTDPDVNYLDAISPYQPLHMRILHYPIDTRLSFAQANKLIRELKPKYLVVPEQYTQPPLLHQGRLDLVIDPQQSKLLKHTSLDLLKLPVNRHYEATEMNPAVAAELKPTEIVPGVAVVQVAAQLKNDDNKYSIEPLGTDFPRAKRRKLHKPIIYGKVSMNEFTRNLEQNGLRDLKVEEIGLDNFIIDLTNEGSLIQVEDSSIHIICSVESERVKIRDALLQSLHKITPARI